jgi:hypothetical protein
MRITKQKKKWPVALVAVCSFFLLASVCWGYAFDLTLQESTAILRLMIGESSVAELNDHSFLLQIKKEEFPHYNEHVLEKIAEIMGAEWAFEHRQGNTLIFKKEDYDVYISVEQLLTGRFVKITIRHFA